MKGLTFRYNLYNQYDIPKREVTLALYDENTTYSDGTIYGNMSLDANGNEAVATEFLNYYQFYNIPAKRYVLIMSGAGVTTQIIDSAFDVPWGPLATGSDIPYKDNSNKSIATIIDEIKTYISMP